MSDDWFEWEEPPPVPEQKGHWKAWAVELRKHPGRWARWPEPLRAVGGITAHLRGTYRLEATSRKQPDGFYAIWARYPKEAA